MEGVSSHFDHVSNTSVMGQQVLTLGRSTDQAFLPLDSQIAISKVKTQGLAKKFKDGRNAGARRMTKLLAKSRSRWEPV